MQVFYVLVTLTALTFGFAISEEGSNGMLHKLYSISIQLTELNHITICVNYRYPITKIRSRQHWSVPQ